MGVCASENASETTMQGVLGRSRTKLYAHPGFSEESTKSLQPAAKALTLSATPHLSSKLGTTWLQWILVMLRTGATEPDFQDIYQVSPWIDLSWDIGVDLDVGSPRVYKSHERLAAVNRGARYIVTIRDPAKTVISWWRFLAAKGAPITKECPNPSRFVENCDFWSQGMRFGASLTEYYQEYYRCRNCEDVLVLCFEDMQKDLRGHLGMIAEFAGIPADDELLDRVAQMGSKDAMTLHESKLDESWTHAHELGRSPDPDSWTPAARVTQGSDEKLDAQALELLDDQWASTFSGLEEPKTYAELVSCIRRALRSRFAARYQIGS